MEDEDNLPVSSFITYRLSQVHNRLNHDAAKILKETVGLSLIQWRVIALIGSQPGSTSTQLTRLGHVDKGLFSRKLKTLVDAGLVEVGDGKTDSRTHPLRLSDKGQGVFDNILPVMQARQRHLRSKLTSDELKTLFAALDKLEAAIED